jgi:hypothetical protein
MCGTRYIPGLPGEKGTEGEEVCSAQKNKPESTESREIKVFS